MISVLGFYCQTHSGTMTDNAKEHSSEPLSQTTGGFKSLRVSPAIDRRYCKYQNDLPANTYSPALTSTFDGAKRASPHCESDVAEEYLRVR